MQFYDYDADLAVYTSSFPVSNDNMMYSLISWQRNLPSFILGNGWCSFITSAIWHECNLLLYINNVSHRIPFDAQHFIERQCIERASAVETHVRYKLKYTVTTNNISAESNVAVKDDGSFELLWTRISSRENMPPSKKMAKFDIVRPGEAQRQRRYCFFWICACV